VQLYEKNPEKIKKQKKPRKSLFLYLRQVLKYLKKKLTVFCIYQYVKSTVLVPKKASQDVVKRFNFNFNFNDGDSRTK